MTTGREIVDELVKVEDELVERHRAGVSVPAPYAPHVGRQTYDSPVAPHPLRSGHDGPPPPVVPEVVEGEGQRRVLLIMTEGEAKDLEWTLAMHCRQSLTGVLETLQGVIAEIDGTGAYGPGEPGTDWTDQGDPE
jgi:hypothetical protein